MERKRQCPPLCDAVSRLPNHAVHGHVQHVFQRLPVAGPLPDAGTHPADGVDRRRLFLPHRKTATGVETRRLPFNAPAGSSLARAVSDQLRRIPDPGLLCIN